MLMMVKTRTCKNLLLLLSFLSLVAKAQEEQKGITLSGSIQSNVLIPQEDKTIGAPDYKDWGLTNTYAELHLQSQAVDAGVRLEYLEHPLPGYEKDFAGWGIPYFYVKGKLKFAEYTLGDFYEQFGSGFILRTYEERSLGIDNSLRGGRLTIKPVAGVTLKALTGRQRRYWEHNKAWVSGADVELNLDEWFSSLRRSNTYITLGGSWVNKHEDDEEIFSEKPDHKLNLPLNVNAFDVRARLQHGGFSVLAEYAHKTQDPNFDNGYIYRPGNVAMLSASYSQRGMSILLQAKRSDNMGFRSRRTMNGTSSMINHLPAFTLEHTYALAARYPYATNPDGEWAYQAEFAYTFKKKTPLGGKYGTGIKLNFSHIHSLNTTPDLLEGKYLKGSNGYTSPFFKWGDQVYYQDLNVQVEKKLSSNFKFNLMYMNQFYNKTVIEGEGGMIHSDIVVGEAQWRINRKLILRGELQYLFTKDDEGDWAFALAELSLNPHWMFTLSDEYNVGSTHVHYYQGLVTFNTGAHRFQLGYGRTRAGFNCSGGVCRYVPASRGLTASYNYNF